MTVFQDGQEYNETGIKVTAFGPTVAPRGGYIEGTVDKGPMTNDTALVRLSSEQFESFIADPLIAKHQPTIDQIEEHVQKPDDPERLVTKIRLRENWNDAKPMTADDLEALPVINIPVREVGPQRKEGYHVLRAAPDYMPRFTPQAEKIEPVIDHTQKQTF